MGGLEHFALAIGELFERAAGRRSVRLVDRSIALALDDQLRAGIELIDASDEGTDVRALRDFEDELPDPS
jgi:hypothetical protein